MRKAGLILITVLIRIVSYSQSPLHSGVNDEPASLYDSGRVELTIKEYNFDSCGITRRQIYKCDFTFKNNNPYPVILNRYDFYTENTTDPINKVGCRIAQVSSSKYSDTLVAKSTKSVSIYGETSGVYQPAGLR